MKMMHSGKIYTLPYNSKEEAKLRSAIRKAGYEFYAHSCGEEIVLKGRGEYARDVSVGLIENNYVYIYTIMGREPAKTLDKLLAKWNQEEKW